MPDEMPESAQKDVDARFSPEAFALIAEVFEKGGLAFAPKSHKALSEVMNWIERNKPKA